MPRNTVHFDEEKSRWSGIALKAFAAAAVLGVAGWQFAKWYQNPIDHEGVKPFDDHVTIGGVKISDPFAVMFNHMGVHEGEGATLGTQIFAEALEKTSKLADEPDPDIHTTAINLTFSQHYEIQSCRHKREAYETYSVYQSEADDSYEKFNALKELRTGYYSHAQIMGISFQKHRGMLAFQAQTTMRHLWQKQQQTGLSALDRYMILDQIKTSYFEAHGSYYQIEDESGLLGGRHVDMFSEKQVETYVGFTYEWAKSVQAELMPSAISELIDEWSRIAKPLNTDSAAAKRFMTAMEVFGSDLQIKAAALGFNDMKILQLLNDHHALVRRHEDERKSKFHPEDYHCAGLPVPGVR